MKKPKTLKPGDRVAAVSLSWGGPSIFPNVLDLGIANVERVLGVEVVEFPTARMPAKELYENPKARARDLMDAFEDPSIAAIFTSIGGDDSVRILPYLDVDRMIDNPKILLGFSDSTTTSAYLCQHGLVTFNGPSLMAGWAQMQHLPPEFEAHVKQLLTKSSNSYEFKPFPQWANHFVEWATPGYAGETSEQRECDGWRWLQGSGMSTGRLYGGCAEVLEFMKGTSFWPEHDFWKDKILFLETSEDKPSPSQVKWMLRNYGSMGALQELKGLLVGRARSYTDQEKVELDKVLVQVVSGEFDRSDMPVVSNMDFGHTAPQWILPLGVQAEIDCQARTFRLTEPALEN